MGTHPIFESDFDCLTEIGKGYPQVGPMSNENVELGLDAMDGTIHHCDNTENFLEYDSDYYSQGSNTSDTPTTPVDETSSPFLPHEQSNFPPGDEESNDEFIPNDENAIDDITKGIAFVLVYEKPTETIKSANIQKIVMAVRDLTQMMRNDMASHFESFEKNLEEGMNKTHIGSNS